MSMVELIPAVQALSRRDKLTLAHLLLDALAHDDQSVGFQQEHVYQVYTPEFASGAATQLAQLQRAEGLLFFY